MRRVAHNLSRSITWQFEWSDSDRERASGEALRWKKGEIDEPHRQSGRTSFLDTCACACGGCAARRSINSSRYVKHACAAVWASTLSHVAPAMELQCFTVGRLVALFCVINVIIYLDRGIVPVRSPGAAPRVAWRYVTSGSDGAGCAEGDRRVH